jgi:predicted Fe-S protein YdhL (DUF1289 family)
LHPGGKALGKKAKIPSPCIDICKDKGGVCIACGRSKKDEKAWKYAESEKEKLALLRDCLDKTDAIGTRAFWEREYRRKCAKKGLDCPLDWLEEEPEHSNGRALTHM